MRALSELSISAYRVVITEALVESVEDMFPTFVPRLLEASTGFLNHYCDGAADKPFSALDFDWLARYTFELFYNVLSLPGEEIHIVDGIVAPDAIPAVENLRSHMGINYFIHNGEQFLGERGSLMLTLVLDLLPAKVQSSTELLSSFALMRSSHELRVNQLH